MKMSMKVWNAIFLGGIGALLVAEPATQAVGKKIYDASAKGRDEIEQPELSAIRKVATVDRSWHFETGTHGLLGVTKAFLAGDKGYLLGQGSGGYRWAINYMAPDPNSKDMICSYTASGSLGGRYRVVSDGWCGLAICVDGGLVDHRKSSWKDSVRWGLNFEGRYGYFGLVANLYQPLCGTEWFKLGGAASETERLFPASGFDIRFSCSALAQWLGVSLEAGSSNRFSKNFFIFRKENQTFPFIQLMCNINIFKSIPFIGWYLAKSLEFEIGLRGVHGANLKYYFFVPVTPALEKFQISVVSRISFDVIGGVQRRAAAMASADLSFYNVSVLKRETSIGPQAEGLAYRQGLEERKQLYNQPVSSAGLNKPLVADSAFELDHSSSNSRSKEVEEKQTPPIQKQDHSSKMQ